MRPHARPRGPRPHVSGSASPMAVVLNREGIILYANPGLADLLAVAPADLRGRAFEELVLPRHHHRFRELLRSGEPEGGVHALILCRTDGQPVPSQVCLQRLEPPGTDVGILVALDAIRHYRFTHRLRQEKAVLERRVRDRTAALLHANQTLHDDARRREAAEAALRTSEAQWRKLFEVSPAVIVVTTPDDGRILEVNDVFLRILGYRREEVIGRTVADIGAWGFRARRDDWLRELRRRGSLQNVEAEVTTKAGEVRVGLVSSGLLEIEGQERILTVIMDITERKRTEEALRLSEERFMQTFRSCPAAMALSRVHDGCFVDVNEAFVKMTGYRREDVVGRSIGIWKRLEDRQAAVRTLLAAGSLRDCEYDFSRKSGETIHGLGAAELVEVGGERLILSLVLDITTRKQAEEGLRHALADKETLIREVHHRVKNNLQILCDLLFLQGELLQGEEGKAAIEDAYRRVFAIARLHEQLYQSLQSGHVNLGEYLGRLMSGYEALAPGARIVLEAPEPAVLMDVDRAIHTGLIVNELVTNALKHAFPKEGTGHVWVRLRGAGDEVELQVEDDGPGLPPALDVERAPSLGLRIVNILSRKLEAAVEIRSEPGTRFTVRFQRQPRA